MNALLLYVIEAAILLNALLWVYQHYLDELALFAWSRTYLVGTLLAAVLLPIVDLPMVPTRIAPLDLLAYQSHTPDQVYLLHKAPNFEAHERYGLLYRVLGGLYLVGAGFFVWRLLWRIVGIYRRPTVPLANGLRQGFDAVPAWSFFGRIVLSQQVLSLPAQQQQWVVEHERAHGQQGHSADTLLAEWVHCLLWFNPLVAQLKRQLSLQHEYLADRHVVRRHPVQAYSRLVLQLASGKVEPGVQGFTSGQVQRRLLMLNRPPVQPLKKLRFLIVLPLVAVWLFVFSLFENAYFDRHVASGLGTANWDFPLRKQFVIVKPFVRAEVHQRGPLRYTLAHPRLAIVAEPQWVLAPATARVLNVWNGEQGSPGKGLSLMLPNGQVFTIEGLASLLVQPGQQVQRSQALGRAGPNELYPKLVFELWKGPLRIDPLSLYRTH